jgi:DNA-binding LytR/AlgR family response regulator
MKMLLIEDEAPAARRLAGLILEIRPNATLLGPLESVEMAVDWLEKNPSPDLIFMDIQLADGLSFDIFQKIEVVAPVIFSTAFDQYLQRAFKVHSVDYLLKPVGRDELLSAIEKFEKHYLVGEKSSNPAALDARFFEKMMQNLQKPAYKSRFLVKNGATLGHLATTEIAYFYSEDSLTFAKTTDRKFMLDQPLDLLESQLDPADYFRISRKLIVSISSVKKIHPHLNGRLKLDLAPATDLETFVSRERVHDFKEWLDK